MGPTGYRVGQKSLFGNTRHWVSIASPAKETKTGLNSGPVTTDALGELSGGTFTLDQTFLETLNGGPLADGPYVVHLQTVDADGVLGFGADERCYDAGVAILRHLGIARVELLTNNPDKVKALEESGIEVAERTPLYGEINRHNLRYVQAKADRSGHWLMDMISQRVSAD